MTLSDSHLVLPVVLLGMAEHSVTQPTDVPERSVSLIAKLLQSEHGPIAAVCERSLQELKDL